jgi:hypothetical protein
MGHLMIDVHCHCYPERYAGLMTRLKGPNQPRSRHPTMPARDIETILEQSAAQILNLSR